MLIIMLIINTLRIYIFPKTHIYTIKQVMTIKKAKQTPLSINAFFKEKFRHLREILRFKHSMLIACKF